MTKTVERTKRNDKATEWIRREWGDLPVVDAQRDLPVVVLPQDVERAVRGDGQCCLFERSFGSQKVLFLRHVAYVDLPDATGNRRVERFLLGPGMRDKIEAFDKGHPVVPKGGFLLKRPKASETMEVKRRRSQRQHARERAEKAAGIFRGRQGQGAYRDKPLVIDLMRHGTGKVPFGRGAKEPSPTTPEPAPRVRRGKRSIRGKLTPTKVREIRRKYATGKYHQTELAERYGISGQMVSFIVNGKAWAGV